MTRAAGSPLAGLPVTGSPVTGVQDAGALALLDNPFWHALVGPQARFGERAGRAARFLPAVSPMGGLEADTPAAWADLAHLTGPGQTVALFAPRELDAPAGWSRVGLGDTLQLVQPQPVPAQPAPESKQGGLRLAELTPADAEAAQALVALTRPGPFGPRTLELGQYLGLWDDAAPGGPLLAALSGQRALLGTPFQGGFREVSAVCTHPDYRRRGLARVLVSRVAAHTHAQGLTPFLHVNRANEAAIGTYLGLGFTLRAPMMVSVMRRDQQGEA